MAWNIDADLKKVGENLRIIRNDRTQAWLKSVAPLAAQAAVRSSKFRR